MAEDRSRRIFDGSVKPDVMAKNMAQAGFASLAVPDEYREHPLVKDRLFYTLPQDLLSGLQQKVGAANLDADLMNMELTLSGIMGDHLNRVGFWGGRPILYSRLERSPVTISEFLRQCGDPEGKMNPELWRLREEQEEKEGRRSHEIATGYCGWLMTNRDFLRERDGVFAAHAQMVAAYGIPRMVHAASRGVEEYCGRAPESARSKAAKCAEAFAVFFAKWRLIEMSAPHLPVPVGPQIPVLLPTTLIGLMKTSGYTIYLPDTFPVPSRDDLRRHLESLRTREVPVHMQEWSRLVGGQTQETLSISRFSRIFRLQHYLRAFHVRHAKSLYRHMDAVQAALAEHLACDERTIRDDMKQIASRISKDWYKSMCVSESA